MLTFVGLSCIITPLKHFSYRRNVPKWAFFGRKQWHHTAVSVRPHRGATEFSPLELILVHKIAPNCEYFTNHLMQYVLQYFYNKSEIFGTHGTMKSPIPSSWSVDYSGPSHVAEATCIFTLFNVERWSAAWSLIINKCIFLISIVLFMIMFT